MGVKYKSKVSVKPYDVALAQPLDVRVVLEFLDDLKSAVFIDSKAYNGMVVFVEENKSLYVCSNKPEEIEDDLTDIEDVWKKLDVDYSVRIVNNKDNLTDGTTIKFPYQGMMAYVKSESALYILLTKGIANSKDINNWKKISNSSSTLVDKVGIDVAPEGGSGFMIAKNENVIIEDYINVEKHIKASYYYTSKGVNSFDANTDFTYDSVTLSKGGKSYIELFVNGDNWMYIWDDDNSLGLKELSGTPIKKNQSVCFGVDIKFTEDCWKISFGDESESRDFIESDYELIDIYRTEYSPVVYAYLKDIDVRVLTEDDLVTINDKIGDLANSIMINLGENGSDSDSDSDSDSGSDDTPVPLQQVIVQMNNSIAKLEQTTVEPDPIEHSEINDLFS